MRERYRRKGKYSLPGTVYMKTVYQIRDYHRLKEKIQDAIDAGPRKDDVHVTSTRTGSVTESKALKIYDDSSIVKAIELAREEVPAEYRLGVWNSVMYNEPFPRDAARSTYGMHKSRFVYTVAEYLGWT